MKFFWLIPVFFLSTVANAVLAVESVPEDIPDELVPCGDPGQPMCETCHVYQLAENVINWISGLAFFVVAILIVYGGFRMATSVGNAAMKRDARKLISTAIVGFMLILSARFLIVFLISILAGVETSGGLWSSLECTVVVESAEE